MKRKNAKTVPPCAPDAKGDGVEGTGQRKYGMRADHWLYETMPGDFHPYPMFERAMNSARIYFGRQNAVGSQMTDSMPVGEFRQMLIDRLRHALRIATAAGTEMDFDPDAFVIDAMNMFCLPRARLGRFDEAPMQSPQNLTDDAEGAQAQK